MPPSLLSHSKLATFLTCQQRFYLRYQRQLAWPPLPTAASWQADSQNGLAFHRLLERHFLNLPTPPPTTNPLTNWWQAFQQSPPPLPLGSRFPEFSLTVPLDKFHLVGRFDLLIISPTTAHIFDWKTGQPRSHHQLQHDWQTRLYLALLTAGHQALNLTLQPDQIHLTYWYPLAPQHPITFTYNQATFDQDWAEIKAVAAAISHQQTQPQWPLTDDLNQCRYCSYQTYCHRIPTTATSPSESTSDWFPLDTPDDSEATFPALDEFGTYRHLL